MEVNNEIVNTAKLSHFEKMDLFVVGEMMKQTAVWMERLNIKYAMLYGGQVHIKDPSAHKNYPTMVARVNSGWWENWGRCAAGILGRSFTKGLEGGINTAAVGSLIPVVGPVSAGVAGAIIRCRWRRYRRYSRSL